MRKTLLSRAGSAAGLLLAMSLALAAERPRIPEPKISFDPRTYVCYRAAGPVTVDGNLDEAV